MSTLPADAGKKSTTSAASSRIGSVDALRGIAALSVTLFHFLVTKQSPMSAIFHQRAWGYMWLGVQSFFVISAFVVPLAMKRAGYRVSDFGRFIGKRIVRLDPPYLVAVVIILLLDLISPAGIYREVPPEPTVPLLIGHVLYGISHFFWSFDWLDGVFWTLEIEFQFYLVMALLVPLLLQKKQWQGMLGMVAFLLLPLLPLSDAHPIALFKWTGVFGIGLILFLRQGGVWTTKQCIPFWMLASTMAWFFASKMAMIVGLSTAAAIVFWQHPAAIFDYLGKVSFSLYLLHVPIGGRIMLYAAKQGWQGPKAVAAFVVAMIASFAAAHLLWLVVEQPSQKVASRIKYLRAPKPVDAPATA